MLQPADAHLGRASGVVAGEPTKGGAMDDSGEWSPLR